jgi:hypothetical protein
MLPVGMLLGETLTGLKHRPCLNSQSARFCLNDPAAPGRSADHGLVQDSHTLGRRPQAWCAHLALSPQEVSQHLPNNEVVTDFFWGNAFGLKQVQHSRAFITPLAVRAS